MPESFGLPMPTLRQHQPDPRGQLIFISHLRLPLQLLLLLILHTVDRMLCTTQAARSACRGPLARSIPSSSVFVYRSIRANSTDAPGEGSPTSGDQPPKPKRRAVPIADSFGDIFIRESSTQSQFFLHEPHRRLHVVLQALSLILKSGR